MISFDGARKLKIMCRCGIATYVKLGDSAPFTSIISIHAGMTAGAPKSNGSAVDDIQDSHTRLITLAPERLAFAVTPVPVACYAPLQHPFHFVPETLITEYRARLGGEANGIEFIPTQGHVE